MLGNFATGLTILMPAGMLAVLAEGLHVGIRETGLLVTFGAAILCFGSPIVIASSGPPGAVPSSSRLSRGNAYSGRSANRLGSCIVTPRRRGLGRPIC